MRRTRLLHSAFLGVAVGALTLTAVRAGAQSQPPVDRPAPAASSARPELQTVGTGPAGATLRCRDGSYPAPKAPDSACAEKGGVLVRFPLRHLPPAATTAAASSAPTTPRVESRAAVDTAVPAGFVPYAVRRAARDTLTGPPAGATLLCKDGSYIVRDTSTARCQSKGGLKLRFAVRPPD